jgi:hypothetical protein
LEKITWERGIIPIIMEKKTWEERGREGKEGKAKYIMGINWNK